MSRRETPLSVVVAIVIVCVLTLAVLTRGKHGCEEAQKDAKLLAAAMWPGGTNTQTTCRDRYVMKRHHYVVTLSADGHPETKLVCDYGLCRATQDGWIP